MYYRTLYYNTVLGKDNIIMQKGKKKFVVTILLFLFIGVVSYLQWGRETDVYSTTVSTSKNYHEEHITFTLNQLFVADKEKCAEEIIKKCRDNNFPSVLFSYDISKPNALYGTVYLSSFGVQWQKPVFTFRYVQKSDKLGSYNIIDNPEAFVLTID